MRKNSLGFSAVEALLILVIVGLLSGLGWYVYSQQKDSKQPVDSVQSNQQGPNQTNNKENSYDAIVGDSKTIASWKSYSYRGIDFKYPQTWKVNTNEEEPNFTSPDYKAPGDGLGASLEAGYLLKVRASTNDNRVAKSFAERLEGLKGTPPCGGDYEVKSVANEPIIISDIQCHGSDLYATIYKNDVEYDLTLSSLDQDKPETRTLFNNILSTIQFK